MTKFLNPSLPSRVLLKNLRAVGEAEDEVDSGLIVFSPNNNPFYSLNLPNTTINSSASNQPDHYIFCTVSSCDVEKTIRSVKSKTIGLDGIPLKFIKLILPEIISLTAHIFKNTISSMTFPSDWKFSKIVPVSKVKDICQYLPAWQHISYLPFCRHS
jgi:hypothetical protein